MGDDLILLQLVPGVCYSELFTVHHANKTAIGFMLEKESVIQTYSIPQW